MIIKYKNTQEHNHHLGIAHIYNHKKIKLQRVQICIMKLHALKKVKNYQMNFLNKQNKKNKIESIHHKIKFFKQSKTNKIIVKNNKLN